MSETPVNHAENSIKNMQGVINAANERLANDGADMGLTGDEVGAGVINVRKILLTDDRALRKETISVALVTYSDEATKRLNMKHSGKQVLLVTGSVLAKSTGEHHEVFSLNLDPNLADMPAEELYAYEVPDLLTEQNHPDAAKNLTQSLRSWPKA